MEMLSKCQVIGPKIEHWHQHLEKGGMRSNTKSIPPAHASQQDGNAKPYNAELLIAGNNSNKPSGRFVPPELNNTGSSSPEMDNSNTTTVYYKKSTGKHQNKSTSIQMLPRHPETRGTTTATQTTNEKASQGSGTQTMPPPSPKKSTSTVRNTNIPSKKSTQAGRPGSHWTAMRKVSWPTQHQVKTRRWRSPPCPGPSTGPAVGPRNDFTSRNLGTWQAHSPVYCMWWVFTLEKGVPIW